MLTQCPKRHGRHFREWDGLLRQEGSDKGPRFLYPNFIGSRTSAAKAPITLKRNRSAKFVCTQRLM
jgi:hypothetical protein